MSGPVLVWEHLAAGFVHPLDGFLERAGDGYDTADFIESLLHCNRWSGRFGDPLGEGALLEIPVNCESYNLAYLPSALEQAGLEVPVTWEQYFTTALSVTIGTGSRGRRVGRPAARARGTRGHIRVCERGLVRRRRLFRGRPLRNRLAYCGARNRRVHDGAARGRADRLA